MGLVLLTRKIWGERTSLLAGGLYAFAVLPIQHAHFFVVDSFATVFVVWTLLLCLYALRNRAPGLVVLAGFMTGLAVSSKISVWPVTAMVGLTGVLAENDEGRLSFEFSYRRMGILVISGLVAALTFRSAQPYAFSGPGFFGIRPNPQWISTMKNIRRMMSGLQDVPFGHQWTARAPILFPLRNMVFWGMGLPLGIAAWMGWAWIGGRWVRERDGFDLMLIPWIWGTVFFLYQSTQWVKSMRYLLPVYPVFALFAAVFLVRLARTNHNRRFFSVASRWLPALVFVGTGLWAWAFMHIYLEPVTRIAASRWMYQNIPTAVTLELRDGDEVQVPIRPNTTLSASSPRTQAVLDVDGEIWVEAVRVNKIDPRSVPGPRLIRVAVDDEIGEGAVTFTEPDIATLRVPLNDAVRIADGDSAVVEIALVRGTSVNLDTSVIANEHWDDGLPLRLGDKDPFWNWYRGLSSSPTGQMNNYDEDTEEKRQQLLDWLDEADVIALSSNRLYASIPRLPMRYPLTTAYYEALFRGDLGFELRAEFVSYPTLGSVQFPDQEIPFPLMAADYSNAEVHSGPFPPAEEAFSVYDHPTVLLFTKTADYSRDLVEAQLPPSLLDNVEWMTPKDATRRQRRRADNTPSLLLTPRLQAEQSAGGTWSELFNTAALHNRMPFLSVLLWWAGLLLLGWMAFPWVYRAFPNLRVRGYGLAKIVGLLAWAYLGWLLASLHLVPHVRLSLGLIFAGGLGIAALLVWRWRGELRGFLRVRGRDILRVELIFLGLYLLWVGIRYLNPDLWHPVTGGEKPMDFAYFNAVIKSTWFPPYDPWFAGGKMNYYYFGFVMFGALTELIGVVPSIAYNLAVPSLFAMTGLGAYTVASNLAGGDDRRAVRAGIWGLLLTVVLGNLGEVQFLYQGLVKLGDVQFESLIPGYPQVISALVGIWKIIAKGRMLPFRPEWWYWDATRMIPFAEGEVGPINEFPAFTFLYADLHAHMMALPLTYVALALALDWGLDVDRPPHRWWRQLLPTAQSSLVLGMLVAGALRATNTWDYPTFLGLMAFGALLGAGPIAVGRRSERNDEGLSESQGLSVAPFLKRLVTPLALFLGAELLFRPFTSNYAVPYTSFELWRGTRTPLSVLIMMLGHLFFPLLVGVWIDGGRVLERFRGNGTLSLPWSGLSLLVAISLLGIGVFVFFFDVPIGWLAVPWGVFAAVQLFLSRRPRRRTLWLWVGSALALTLLVEVLVLKGDIGRMNTVFKFHFQVWTLLGLSAAVFVERLFHGAVFGVHGPGAERVAGVALAVLLVGTAFYPVFAIPAKVSDRWAPEAPHTLDGMIFMGYATQYEHGGEIPLWADYEVIRWLQENVAGSPVILEGLGAREYLWGSRISVYTGLPAVAAWRWHQVQQRGVMPSGTVEARMQDVRYFYNGASPAESMDILEEYQVEYVMVTPYERAYMVPESEAKFAQLVREGSLEVAYQDDYSTVYRVNLGLS